MILPERFSHYQDILRAACPAQASLGTNFYATVAQIEAWIERGVVSLLPCPDALLIFRKDQDFQHLSYMASGPDQLEAALDHPEVPFHRDLAVDLVGAGATLETWAEPFRRKGFAPYRELVRMACLSPEPAHSDPSDEVTFAAPQDAERILMFMVSLLDPLAEQIPELTDLCAWADLGQVLVVKSEEAILGLLIFEKKGQAAVLRYWFVAESEKGRGIGAKLIRTFFHLCRKCRRITLWVFSDNADSIAKYEHFGFRKEPLFDLILLRRKSFKCKEHP